ncbi:hypothetical protein [Streptomyces sp. NPDC059957]
MLAVTTVFSLLAALLALRTLRSRLIRRSSSRPFCAFARLSTDPTLHT